MLAEALPLLTGDQGGCPPLCYVTHRAASPGRCRPSAPAPSLHHMLHLASMRTYRVCTCPTCVCVCASMSLSKVLSLGLGLGSGLGSGSTRADSRPFLYAPWLLSQPLRCDEMLPRDCLTRMPRAWPAARLVQAWERPVCVRNAVCGSVLHR